MAPIQCQHCSTINEPGVKYCGRCGLPLTKQEKQTMKQIVSEIEEHPLFRALMDEMRKKVSDMSVG